MPNQTEALSSDSYFQRTGVCQVERQKSKTYRDSAALKLAAEINDFVRSRIDNSTVATMALEAARATFSLVPWPPTDRESPERPLSLKSGSE